MIRSWILALVTAGLLTSPPALGQTAPAEPEAATDVDSVVVIGRREPAPEVIPPRVYPCLEGTKDPYIATLQGLPGGGPRIYLPTRPPRNPNYDAPPSTAPGSALPDVMSLYEYTRSLRTSPKTLREAAQELAAERAKLDAEMAATGAVYQSIFDRPGRARMRAIAECLNGGRTNMSTAMSITFLPGGTFTGPMAGASTDRPFSPEMRDETLPLGFALFEDGRYEEALEQFKAADRKLLNPEAPLMVGKIYLFALREKSDPVEAVAWLKKTADRKFSIWGDTPIFDPREPDRNTAMGEAAMILADIYRDGRGPIQKDPAQARKYLERAYEVGHIPAAKRLGDIYYQGLDTPRDLKLAFKHYLDAAKFAYLPAMTAVAQMYDAGEVEGGPDPVKALAWRNQAAKADDPAALYALAIAYDHGQGVAADPERALALYKLSAMNGEPAAFTALGTYFYRGEAGLAQHLPTARQWFEQAAIAGDADGMANVAAMMAKGEGGEVDRVRAWGWLKIADRQGHPNAGAAARAIEGQFTPADRAGVLELTRAAEAAPPQAPQTDPEAQIATEFVGSAPGGPPWWTVSKGEATVWVMGLPAGRTLQTQSWNDGPLRGLLYQARMIVLPRAPWEALNGLDTAPWMPLPDSLGGRVYSAAAKAGKRTPHLAPSFADAVTMLRDYYDRRRLVDHRPPTDILKAAFDRKVDFAMSPQRLGPALSSLNYAGAEVAECVEGVLADVATPPEASKAAAQAWASGDVAGALAAPPGVRWACRALWPNHWEETVGFQTETIAMALDMPGKVVVVADIGQLVAQTGILPQLRARGFEVSGPTQPPGQ